MDEEGRARAARDASDMWGRAVEGANGRRCPFMNWATCKGDRCVLINPRRGQDGQPDCGLAAIVAKVLED